MDENLPEVVTIKKSRAPLYISVGLLATLLVCYFAIPSVQLWINEAWDILTSGDEARIHDWVATFGWFGPILIILIMVAQMFLIVIPSWLLMIVSIVAYGPIWGSIIVFIAIYVASSTGYFIGRYFGPAITQKLLGAKVQKKVTDFIEHYGIWAIVVTRLNPMLSNDAISFMAGIVKMNYWRFTAATLAGIAPLIILIAVLGQFSNGLETGLLWGSIISLVAFIGYVWWDKRRRKRIRS